MQIYKVGGAVRDRLLNRSVSDIDWVVVGASAEDLESQGYKQVGKDFPVFLHPQTHQEYALARKESKVAPGYKGFEFDASKNVTLEEDLLRRDLTINAMAEDDQGNLIDPYHGKADLEKGILRHVSNAFAEDPVRILRVARFAARYGFEVADDTLQLMKEMVAAGEVNELVAERVWAELDKALGEEHLYLFFEVLRSCAALAVIFPEIDRLFGVPQTEKYHPEIDTGVHVMMVLQQAVRLTNDKAVRFAALVHDLGKGTTPADILPSHHGHEQRSASLTKALCKRIRVPNEYRDLGVMVSLYHTHCHKVKELKPSTVLKTLEKMDAFRRPDRFDQFLLTCKADALGRKGMEENAYPQAAYFRTLFDAAAEVDVNEIIKAGFEDQKIGEELRRRRIAHIKHKASELN
jgi:tRNA nucleotidyltransferase (CCA-adding enzyme)